MEADEHDFFSGMPSKRQQSWGATIAIVVIVLMIVLGAYYAWNKRVAKLHAAAQATSTPVLP